MNELERILTDIDAPDPSPGFAAEVMSIIRHDAMPRMTSAPLWLLGVSALGIVVLILLVISVSGGDPVSGLASAEPVGKAGWGGLLVVATTIAAILPLQLFDS